MGPERRGHDSLYPEVFERERDAADVGDRIQGTDLVKVTLVRLGAVDPGLGFREPPEGLVRPAACPAGRSAPSISPPRLSSACSRWGGAMTSTWAALISWRVVRDTAISIALPGIVFKPALTRSSLAPASSSAARSMSPRRRRCNRCIEASTRSR